MLQVFAGRWSTFQGKKCVVCLGSITGNKMCFAECLNMSATCCAACGARLIDAPGVTGSAESRFLKKNLSLWGWLRCIFLCCVLLWPVMVRRPRRCRYELLFFFVFFACPFLCSRESLVILPSLTACAAPRRGAAPARGAGLDFFEKSWCHKPLFKFPTLSGPRGDFGRRSGAFFGLFSLFLPFPPFFSLCFF